MNAVKLTCSLPIFYNIIFAEIYLNIHANIPKYVWRSIFAKCPALESIDITPAASMTDGELQDVLTRAHNDNCLNQHGI